MRLFGLDMERFVDSLVRVCELITDFAQRTLLGDPFFVDGMSEYQADILKQSTINEIRNKILDYQTQNVSVYDPEGLESIETYVTTLQLAHWKYII